MEITNINSMPLSELRELVIKSAEEFYLNKDNGINIPDTVYDEMYDRLTKEDPSFNIFKEIPFQGKKIRHSAHFPLATKVKIPGVENVVINIDYSTFRQMVMKNMLPLLGGKVVFLASYQDGKLKYILTLLGKSSDNQPIMSTRLMISDYNAILPRTLHKGHFRMIVLVDPNVVDGKPFSWSNPACVGVIPEVEFETADWSDIRKELVKSEYFANLTLLSPMSESIQINSCLSKELIDAYSQEKWFRYIPVSPKASFTPKMDGCSSVTYYRDGEKQYTASRSDDVTGHDKTLYFDPFIPRYINFPGKLMLMHELVIDLAWGFGWNSRQKANGLTNSKYSQDQVALYATWVVYDAKDGDGNRVPLGLIKKVLYEADSDVFLSSDMIPQINLNTKNKLYECPATKEYLCQILSSNLESGNLCVLPASFITRMDSLGKKVTYGLDKNYTRKISQNPENSEVLSHGIIGPYRFCQIRDYMGNTYYITNSLSVNHRVRVCDEFELEDSFVYLDESLQAHYRHSDGGTFLVDGICLHERRENKKTKVVEPFHNILKFEYNEVVDTKVIRIDWNESEFGTFIPTVVFDTVLVEGSYLSKASIGGWQLLKKRKCGVGADIKVVRVNSTIPQILHVVTPVEPELPTCPHCGRQLTEEKDLIGGVFKCSDMYCPGKLSAKKWFLSDDHEWDPSTDLLDRLIRLVNIERYNKARRELPKEYLDNIMQLMIDDDYEGFVSYVKTNVFIHMTGNNIDGFNYGIRAAYDALRTKLDILTNK